MANDLVERLRSIPASVATESIQRLAFEAANDIVRLRKIETAARALQFSAYPAHGSGFVTQVHGGNINDLEAALDAGKE